MDKELVKVLIDIAEFAIQKLSKLIKEPPAFHIEWMWESYSPKPLCALCDMQIPFDLGPNLVAKIGNNVSEVFVCMSCCKKYDMNTYLKYNELVKIKYDYLNNKLPKQIINEINQKYDEGLSGFLTEHYVDGLLGKVLSTTKQKTIDFYKYNDLDSNDDEDYYDYMERKYGMRK